MRARDYSSGQWIDATTATYLVGSDLSHCAMNEVRRDAQGSVLAKSYDRCLPSIVAFASRDAAEKYQKQNGGQIASFEKLTVDSRAAQ